METPNQNATDETVAAGEEQMEEVVTQVEWGKPIQPYESNGVNPVGEIAGRTALRHSGL
jgi:hypothetical protein